jgi:hypothetical protein
MIIVYSGRGGWILGILLLSAVLVISLDRWLFPQDTGLVPLAIAFAISGIFCLGLGMHARLQHPRMARERETGRERRMLVVHSLYWIRAEYWGLLYLGLAAWFGTLHPER